MTKPAEAGWTIQLGEAPIIGTAIHSGAGMRPANLDLSALSRHERFREEDPFTEKLILDFPNRIVVHTSRFEVDLNRAREAAIYLDPSQSWGLQVWRERPADDVIVDSLAFHDAYYVELKRVLTDIEKRHGNFVVVDVHSYNHRRDGRDVQPSPQDTAPDINIGTFSMDRRRWAHVVDPFMTELSKHRLNGRPLDVRENVSFQGKGEQTRFIHANFPETGCAIAVEFKKIFMDEWTGEPDHAAIRQLRAALSSTIQVLEKALEAGA